MQFVVSFENCSFSLLAQTPKALGGTKRKGTFSKEFFIFLDQKMKTVHKILKFLQGFKIF